MYQKGEVIMFPYGRSASDESPQPHIIGDIGADISYREGHQLTSAHIFITFQSQIFVYDTNVDAKE